MEAGEIFAILGPNGAGKSTIVGSIAGLRTPDSGHIEVFGFDPLVDTAEVRSRLGVQLQESRFQGSLMVMAAYVLLLGALAIWLFRWD